ncbi:MAG: efflux RND transporter periplasmic adaptor subunit [Acidobacteria bacterium]|nr:efflux RND transporter periplasmic adaptor subunit [Acidobacteriota bacterium]
MKRYISTIALIAIITASLTTLNSCKRNEPAASASRGASPGGPGGPGAPGGSGASNLPSKDVKLANSESRKLSRVVSAPSTLAADEQATVSFKVPGRLSVLKIDLGSKVRKGQAIAQLETMDFVVRLQQAEAALQQARARLGLPPQGEDDRIDPEKTATVRQAKAILEESSQNRERSIQLVNQGIQPKAELDRVDSAFKVADSRYQDALEEVRNRQAVLLQRRSELQIAKQQLQETTLDAPFDGAIRERRASLGEFLSAGTPVATIVRLHPLRLRVEIPERDAQGIRIGQSVKVTIEGDLGQTYGGRIARLSPAFQEQSRTLIIEAVVDNTDGKLRPGTFAKAEILTTSTSDVVMVPATSIVTFAGIQKVFTIKDGKAQELNVNVGRQEGDWIVVDGVKPDIPIVLSPGNLITGQPVKVINN